MKIKNNTFILFFLAILLIGCKAKETTIERTKQSDSLVTSISKYESKPISTNYQIMLECDSLGRVKPVNALEKSGVNSFGFSINNQMLNIWGETGKSIDTNKETKQVSESQSEKENKITRYRTHPYHWIAHLLSILIIIILLKFKSKIPFI